MLKNKHLLVSFFCFVILTISAQNPERPRLITGPVLGAVSATTARVWFAYKGDGQNLVSLQDMNDNTFYRATRFEKINDKTFCFFYYCISSYGSLPLFNIRNIRI